MGPHTPGSLRLYVVIDFHKSTLDYSLIHSSPSKYIPIPVTTNICVTKYCCMRTILLRIYKAIAIYKSRCITDGPGKVWGKVVAGLPIRRQRIILV